jgi:hypothetical protein
MQAVIICSLISCTIYRLDDNKYYFHADYLDNLLKNVVFFNYFLAKN